MRMKSVFMLFGCLLLGGLLTAQAQTVRITGTVTSSEDGMPLPGVSVVVKGTTIGGATDANGRYEVNVPADAQFLMFSFVGFKVQEVAIAGSSTIDIALLPESLEMQEVVVTALGITREKKALGYAVSDVKGDELANVRTQNVVSALSGRVPGVQITTASGQMGGGAKINIRGNSSLTGNNQPLFVVDGVPLDNKDYSSGETGRGGYDLGNLAADVNPDDVENISVLKGASATALYGSRAANGVVMITTKKGVSGEGDHFGVTVNSSVTLEKAQYFPRYQKLYGAQLGTTTINGTPYETVQYAIDETWGPAYDPNRMVLRWNSFDLWDSENYLKPAPWVYPEHDYTYFFKLGRTWQNNMAIQGSSGHTTYRVSYTNMDATGITPNSSLKRNTVNANVTSKLSRWIDSWANVTYVQNSAKGRPETGYGDKNPAQKMWQWIQTNVDYKDMENYVNPDGTQRTWNRTSAEDATPLYSDNPYWSAYRNYQNDRRDRVFGITGLNLTLLPWLKLTGRMGVDFYKMTMEDRIAMGSQAQSYYTLNVYSNMEANKEVFLSVNQRFASDAVGLAAIVGANQMDTRYWRNGGTTVGGLMAPELYNLSNSITKANLYDYKSWKRINSVYANISLDWNRLLFLELTGRNDWSSTLPANNRSYFYPSATLSVLLSEFDFLKGNRVVSYAKLRGGAAQVGNDTSPYTLMNDVFPSTPFGTTAQQYVESTRRNPDLKPEKTTSWEVGAEVRFLNNRVGMDLSYFYKATTDQIIPITVSPSTGWNSTYINAGKMTNRGVELALDGTPVQTRDFRWNLLLNLGTLNNKVNDLAPGIDYIRLGSAPFRVQTGAFLGNAYPIIYGTDYVYDDHGNRVVGTNGRYLASSIKPLANVTPNLTAGLTNTLTYRNFELSVLVDMQRGGHMFYTSYMWGMYSGILAESAAVNENGMNIRDAPTDGGGVLLNGVYGKVVNGQVVYTDASGATSTSPVPNATRIAGRIYSKLHYGNVDMQNVFSSDFIKLREVCLSYTLPARFTGPIKNVRVSAFGRNLAIFGAATQHFDPEYLQVAGSNAQGIEGGYLPGTMSFGFGLNFNF